MKAFAIFLFELHFSTGLMAQDYQKNWSDGKLTWNDFKEKESGQNISELKYFLGYSAAKQKIGDTIVVRNKAKCYMDKKLSWINPAYKTEQYLRYNQVIFDIVEIHRRRLQIELDKVNSLSEIEGNFNDIYSSCNTEIDKLDKESNGGKDLKSIIIWENKSFEELKTYAANRIPEFEDRNFGYGLHAGFGSGFFTGSLGKTFAPTFNFMYGFDLAYKKSILYLSGSLGFDKLRKDYLSNKNWYKGQNVSFAILDVSYGYAFIDKGKIKLSPFVGFGVTEFTGENKDNKESELRITDYNVILGACLDYKIRTKLKLIPDLFVGLQEKVVTSVRAKLYITQANYYTDLKGYSINLTIGLSGFGNRIRLK